MSLNQNTLTQNTVNKKLNTAFDEFKKKSNYFIVAKEFEDYKKLNDTERSIFVNLVYKWYNANYDHDTENIFNFFYEYSGSYSRGHNVHSDFGILKRNEWDAIKYQPKNKMKRNTYVYKSQQQYQNNESGPNETDLWTKAKNAAKLYKKKLNAFNTLPGEWNSGYLNEVTAIKKSYNNQKQHLTANEVRKINNKNKAFTNLTTGTIKNNVEAKKAACKVLVPNSKGMGYLNKTGKKKFLGLSVSKNTGPYRECKEAFGARTQGGKKPVKKTTTKKPTTKKPVKKTKTKKPVKKTTTKKPTTKKPVKKPTTKKPVKKTTTKKPVKKPTTKKPVKKTTTKKPIKK